MKILKSSVSTPSQSVVFFDGLCLFCNTWVAYLLERDQGKFLFAPLQGETAKLHVPKPYRENLNSVVLLRDDSILDASDAVIAILVALGGPWRLMSIFKIVPKVIRDFVYKTFARVRHKITTPGACRVLTPAERKRFLP